MSSDVSGSGRRVRVRRLEVSLGSSRSAVYLRRDEKNVASRFLRSFVADLVLFKQRAHSENRKESFTSPVGA